MHMQIFKKKKNTFDGMAKKRRVNNEWESLTENASYVADNASQTEIVKIS